MPLAWSKLIEEPDDLLVALLIDKVESLCGYKPDESTVVTFLGDKKSVLQPLQDRVEAIPDESKKPVSGKKLPSRSPLTTAAFPCIDRNVLPAGLADILEVSLEMYVNGRGYNSAVRTVFKRRGLRSIHTIYDKCTRFIGLDTEGFNALVNNKEELATYLKQRFPGNERYIDNCLGN